MQGEIIWDCVQKEPIGKFRDVAGPVSGPGLQTFVLSAFPNVYYILQ